MQAMKRIMISPCARRGGASDIINDEPVEPIQSSLNPSSMKRLTWSRAHLLCSPVSRSRTVTV